MRLMSFKRTGRESFGDRNRRRRRSTRAGGSQGAARTLRDALLADSLPALRRLAS